MSKKQHRNVPQLAIQSAYIWRKGETDIIVVSAMLFSILSCVISILKSFVVSQKESAVKCCDTSENRAKYNYRAKKLFRMRIECEYLKIYHRYTHKLILQSICRALEIDNTGNIEVFYIYSIRNAIIVYIDVSNVNLGANNNRMSNKNNIFNDILKLDNNYHVSSMNVNNSFTNENIAFRQEICEHLQFEYENIDINDIIKVYIIEDKNSLEFNKSRISVCVDSRQQNIQKKEDDP